MSRNVSQYFDVLGFRGEQRLVEDLIIESIKISGMKVLYVPRTLVKEDLIFGEDPQSKFIQSFPIEMYFDSPQGFEGQKDIISKFGFEMRDQANFIVSRRRFNQAILYDGFNSIPETNIGTSLAEWNSQHNIKTTSTEVRPMEGDLIYLPLTNDVFQIAFAEHESVFYQIGYRYIWRINVHKFDYSSEIFATGEPSIDRVQQLFDNLDTTANDPIADNEQIRKEATDILDFTADNPFGDPDHNTRRTLTQFGFSTILASHTFDNNFQVGAFQ